MVEQSFQSRWDYYRNAIYKVEVSDRVLYSTGPRFTGTSGEASGGARSEYVYPEQQTLRREPVYVSGLKSVEYRSYSDFFWTEADYRLYREYGVLGRCPDGSRRRGGQLCSEPDGTTPTGPIQNVWLHRLSIGIG